ncbi:MAG: efflux RND transporter permease subunit [Crocinitomicaceae bacterium]|nr:efflux RND transporter permease subunit [Crocinitomicaceae bacterium]
MLNGIVKFFLDNKLIAWLLLNIFLLWGISTAPFDISIASSIPRDPVSVDAIPDIGENQQIVFTKWMGRSPQDVEDQITSPLTSALLGIPGVKSVRSNSMFGFSSIYLIFEEDVEFYWSRSRILEKLNSLPANTIPNGVQPTLGPDATALGQIYWYTLEGRDEHGNVTGGWDQQELRSIQDFYVKYGLQSAGGVSEVASIGGFVKEYQVDVDPDKMRAYGLSLDQVMKSIKECNLDIGAQTVEINLVEYFVRGLGYVKNIEDIESSVIKVVDNVPVRISDVATVHLGPATRRGVLDKSGAPAVGGVVVARYGANPLEVINNVKAQINELAVGLPSKILEDGTVSQVTIVPFYDRSVLIKETIGTLEEALTLEVLITIIVVILMLLHLKSSLLVSASLPVAVLMCFIAMRYFGIDANIVALSGIAIAVGTMVDMGIVLTESMVAQMKIAPAAQSLKTTIYIATTEVASAVVTAVATTIVSFLPVFTMEAAEGKLFRPLAFTKSFALLASIILAVTIIPPLAEQLFKLKSKGKISAYLGNGALIALSIALLFSRFPVFGEFGLLVGAGGLVSTYAEGNKSEWWIKQFQYAKNISYALYVSFILAQIWMPLGVTKSVFSNFLFIIIIIGGLIGFFYMIIHFYERILRFLLRTKYLFLILILLLVYSGFRIFKSTGPEFMPSLDEGSFLLMPTSMPHSGMEVNEANLRLLDMSVTSIPEVELVVGKAGRVESSLDPAPMSMYENIITYKSEYKTDENGHRIRFRVDDNDEYVYDSAGELIPDENGKYFRQWRDHIKSPDDIWDEIVEATKIPGLTSAPKLQPIETRLVMLQTGMRAPMGIKVKGANLEDIEEFGLKLEMFLKEVDGVKASAVFADRIVGKPYMMLDIKREEIMRHGLTIVQVQNQLQTAIGGMVMTSTVEGRERYGIRLRYPQEMRNDPEKIKSIYISTPTGAQVPLGDLIDINYEPGPMSIKSEDGFLIGFVLFDMDPEAQKENGDSYSEVEVVNNAQEYIQGKIKAGVLTVPAGISFKFAGNYEQQVRAGERLSIVLPISLSLIFLILYLHFKSVWTSLFVFSGVFVAFSGGFIMIWLYGQGWFMNFDVFGTNMRELFQMHSIKLSVAVWVGFLALFGIATDDGVLVGTFLKDSFKKNHPESIEGIRDAVVEGGLRRVKPAMMTTATTILALLPVLSSTGKGSDIMLPMAIPSFGGMVLNIVTMFTVPVLYCLWKETNFKWEKFRGIPVTSLPNSGSDETKKLET